MGFDYTRDFVKVPRSLIRTLLPHPLALALLMMYQERARWNAGSDIRAGRGVIELAPGEAVFGRDEAAVVLRSTASKIRTATRLLIDISAIAIKTTSRGTIVTVRGYGECDAKEEAKSPAESHANSQPIASGSPADDQRIASPSPADRQPIATNVEVRSKTEKEEEQKTPLPPKGARSKSKPDWTEAERSSALLVLQKLSARSGVDYRGSDRHIGLIVGRMRAGATDIDLRAIIGYCAVELQWASKPEMQPFLRPETLFGPQTIDRYLDAARTWFAKLPDNRIDHRRIEAA